MRQRIKLCTRRSSRKCGIYNTLRDVSGSHVRNDLTTLHLNITSTPKEEHRKIISIIMKENNTKFFVSMLFNGKLEEERSRKKIEFSTWYMQLFLCVNAYTTITSVSI